MLACWQAAFLSPYPLEIALYNPIASAYCPCCCAHLPVLSNRYDIYIYIYMLYSVFYILCILFVFTSINPPVSAETKTDVFPRHLWALLTSTQMVPCTATHHHSFLKGQMLPFYKWPTPSQNPTCTVCRQLFQVVRASNAFSDILYQRGLSLHALVSYISKGEADLQRWQTHFVSSPLLSLHPGLGFFLWRDYFSCLFFFFFLTLLWS